MTEGLHIVASADSYTVTVARLDHALRDRNLVPMLRFDHAAAAASAGLALRPLLLVIFGDPRLGTAMMQNNPTIGIDLPLKLLIWEAANDQVFVAYNDPSWLRNRHGLEPISVESDRMAENLRALAIIAAGNNGSC